MLEAVLTSWAAGLILMLCMWVIEKIRMTFMTPDQTEKYERRKLRQRAFRGDDY